MKNTKTKKRIVQLVSLLMIKCMTMILLAGCGSISVVSLFEEEQLGVNPASAEIISIVSANDSILSSEVESYEAVELEEMYVLELAANVQDIYGYSTSYEKVESTKLYSEINYKSNLSTTYLGAVLWGNMTDSGLELSSVSGQQPAIEISVVSPTNSFSASKTVALPSSSTVSSATAELVSGLSNIDSTTELEYFNYSFGSKAELLAFLDVDNLFSNSTELGENYFAIVLKEYKYSVVVDRKNSNEYFCEEWTAEQITEYMQETGSVPLYISQVDYGSIHTFIFSSKSLSESDLATKINSGLDYFSVESFLSSITSNGVFTSDDITVRYINIYGGSSSDLNYVITSASDVNTSTGTTGMPIAYHYSYVSTGAEANLVLKTEAIVPNYELIVPAKFYANSTYEEVEKGSVYSLDKYFTYTSGTLFTPEYSLVYDVDGISIQNGILTVDKTVSLDQQFVVQCDMVLTSGILPSGTNVPDSVRVTFGIEDNVTHTTVNLSELDSVFESSDLSLIKTLTINVDTDEVVSRYTIPSTMTIIEIIGESMPYESVSSVDDLKSQISDISAEAVSLNFSFEERSSAVTVVLNDVILSKLTSSAILDTSNVSDTMTIKFVGNSGLVSQNSSVDPILVSAQGLYLKSEAGSTGIFYGADASKTIIQSVGSNNVYSVSDETAIFMHGSNDYDPNESAITYTSSESLSLMAHGSSSQISVTNVPQDEVVFTSSGSSNISVDSSGLVTVASNSKRAGSETGYVTASYTKNGETISRTITVTTENVYDISSATEFKTYVSKYGSTSSVVFNQTADIDFGSSTTGNYTLSGTYYGNGYNVTGIKMTLSAIDVSSDTYYGLFGIINSTGYVGDLNVDAYICCDSYHDDTQYVYAGAVAGVSYGTIENCSSSGTITVLRYTSCAGGIVGETRDYAEVLYCSNSATVYSNRRTGGISGYSKGYSYYYGCTNSGLVKLYRISQGWFTSSYGSAGGIVGCAISYTTISNCSNSGDINIMNVDSAAGGICGEKNSSVTITSCTNTGSCLNYDGTWGNMYGKIYS